MPWGRPSERLQRVAAWAGRAASRAGAKPPWKPLHRVEVEREASAPTEGLPLPWERLQRAATWREASISRARLLEEQRMQVKR